MILGLKDGWDSQSRKPIITVFDLEKMHNKNIFTEAAVCHLDAEWIDPWIKPNKTFAYIKHASMISTPAKPCHRLSGSWQLSQDSQSRPQLRSTQQRRDPVCNVLLTMEMFHNVLDPHVRCSPRHGAQVLCQG